MAQHANGYAKPWSLVTTSWIAENGQDPGVRLLKSNEDALLYETGHVPGARSIPWAQAAKGGRLRPRPGREGHLGGGA
jgi:3-mercaptopyruvate sulfurtransferase SseA